MVDLSKTEENLLDKFTQSALNYDYSIQRLVESRRDVRTLTGEDVSSHPNGAYLLIKAFVEHWNNIINSKNELKEVLLSPELPSSMDLEGMLAALLRLQRVYNLTAAQVYSGNIAGFRGPALTSADAVAIGRRAFSDGMLKQSADWLTLAHDRLQGHSPGVGLGLISARASTPGDQAQILGLLGRTYIRLGDRQMATRLYHQGALLGQELGDVRELGVELNTPGIDFSHAAQFDKDPHLDGMHRLCTRDKNQIVGQVRPYHRCRYKSSLHVPYRRYKEEILSLAPYASLFHDALTSQECDQVQQLAQSKLSRAMLHNNGEQGQHYTQVDLHTRTAALNWISDSQSPLVRRISRRVMDMTGLEADDRNDSLRASAEMLQVLNYGLGGHFSTHLDAFEDTSSRVVNSGTRIATFLLYLEDVESGGHTAFINADISVPPVKGQGLFWFNTKPNGEIDRNTHHAGCPVLKGHKWIANKWIWTEGNMYRRPCGPRPESTQLDVDKITYSRRQNIPFP